MINALVLHKWWAGDTSARVVFFTREQGLITAFCSGGRTPKKQALLQAFTPLWLTLDMRRDWYYVRQIEHADVAFSLVDISLFAGLYINELLYHALNMGSEPMPWLFDAYLQVLAELLPARERVAIERILRAFELLFLAAIGYELTLTHEAHTNKPIVAEGYYTFVAGVGFSATRIGIAGVDILAIAGGDLQQRSALTAAKNILRHAIDHALGGKKIRVRNMYHAYLRAC